MRFRNVNIGKAAQFSDFVQNILARRNESSFSVKIQYSPPQFSSPRGIGNKPSQNKTLGNFLARRISLKPTRSPLSLNRIFLGLAVAFWMLILAFAPAMAQTSPCIETNSIKFVQPPRLDGGYDAWDSGPWVLADDFICTNTGPITDIHIWGSWLNDLADQNTTFWLGIYDDVPAVNGPNPIQSRPGTNLVWQQYFGPGQYAESFYANGICQLFDPGPPATMGPDSKTYYYCFYPTNPPVQQGTATAPRIYWLAVYAMPSQGTANLFGWKSSALPRQFDISTHTPWPGSAPITSAWVPTYDSSPNRVAIDLAFKVNTATNQPPPPCCPETNGVKFVQNPNILNGLDVNATRNPAVPVLVLADDFRCTNTGPVNDIRIWGSWLHDVIDPNAVFTLSIWSDVPKDAAGNPSHPGMVLWSQPFRAGEYSQCFYTNRSEPFFDPVTPAILGPDTNIYSFCFFPTNPFVQQGTTAAPTNYWLSVNVQTTAGTQMLFGWHSSFESYNDVAVWGKGPFPTPTDWNTMADPQGVPLSMAFKVNTATNNCPPPILLCAPNKTVECGSSWTFDPPTVIDPCCPTYSFTNFDSTNGSCPQNISRVFVLTDCRGLTAVCTQVVSVVDTTPPTLTCATNKTVECGSSWSFDEPTVSDNCCTNQPVVLNTVTNTGNCPQVITRTWLARDCCGNTNTCSQTVFVVDTTPPTIYCPTNRTVECGSTWSFDTPVAYDTCCSNVSVTIYKTVTNSATCPQIITRTWAATDCCGNSNLCSQMITVADTMPPSITCAPDRTVQCGQPWDFDPPTASDRCCSNVTLIPLSTMTNGTCPMVATRIWKATDCCNNSSTCTNRVTVMNTTPPTIVCPAVKTYECGTPWDFDPPTVSAPCCGTNYSVYTLGSATNGTPCDKIISRILMAVDCCGNQSITCTQYVRIIDTTPPVVICPTNRLVTTCATNAVVTWSVSAYDSCSTNVTVTSTPPSGTVFNTGTTNTVHVTATDGCGNTNTCSFQVVVQRPILTMTISHSGTTITISYSDGVLQESTSIFGPWTDVAGATPPSYTTSATGPHKFYRVRCP